MRCASHCNNNNDTGVISYQSQGFVRDHEALAFLLGKFWPHQLRLRNRSRIPSGHITPLPLSRMAGGVQKLAPSESDGALTRGRKCREDAGGSAHEEQEAEKLGGLERAACGGVARCEERREGVLVEREACTVDAWSSSTPHRLVAATWPPLEKGCAAEPWMKWRP